MIGSVCPIPRVDSLACRQEPAAIVGNRSKQHMVRLSVTKTKDILSLTCPFSLPWSWSTSLDQQPRVRVPYRCRHSPTPSAPPGCYLPCTVGETHAQPEDRQAHQDRARRPTSPSPNASPLARCSAWATPAPRIARNATDAQRLKETEQVGDHSVSRPSE